MSLVAFYLKYSNFPTHLPITDGKTDSTVNISFVCLKNFKIGPWPNQIQVK